MIHIKFQNAEPLIEKYNLDLFERYDLTKEINRIISTTNKNSIKTAATNSREDISSTSSYSSSDYLVNSNNNNSSNSNYNNNINYYYYDTVNKDLKDINTININDTTQLNNQINSKMMDASFNSSSSLSNRVTYPLSFIDAVNKKQLDLESGLFRDPKTGSFSMRLNEALQLNLLNPKSVYFSDPNLNKTFDLNEAFKQGLLITPTISNTSNGNSNRIVILQSKNSKKASAITLADALKTGYLKLGQAAPAVNATNTAVTAPANGIQTTTTKTTLSNSNSNCSITSETQSMSVRSIKDPNTGEFLMPTEAIKRKLLDPYKGQFYNPLTGDRLPISEAIQKGFVIVEIIADTSTTTTTSNVKPISDSNIVSTSLIRETKSYHLLGVYDPLKNDEITIKEAIARGILDRQKGLYIHPVTKESFSISDAINKGVIRARILTPKDTTTATSTSMTEQLPFQSLVSTNRFEENKSYTISGAIDPRTGLRISLSQAVKDGIIDAKNGTYINIKTGETISIRW